MKHAPDPIRGLLHILGLTLTFVGIALLSAKKGYGFFIFYILRTIYDVTTSRLGQMASPTLML